MLLVKEKVLPNLETKDGHEWVLFDHYDAGGVFHHRPFPLAVRTPTQ